MKNWKAIIKKAIYPPFFLIGILLLISVFALVGIFQNRLDYSVLAYVVYIISAYTLTVLIIRIATVIKTGKDRLYHNRLFHRYMTDMDFKAEISLYLSFGINIIYSLYEAVSGLLYRSMWFGTVAGYYMLLSLERFLLLKHIRKGSTDIVQEYKRFRFCGILLIAITITVTFLSAFIIGNGKTAVYPGHMIYAVAGYCFYNFTVAIINIVKYKKRKNPIHTASKILTLSTALFSMFSLQNAMISAFGEDRLFQRRMNIGTGFAVFLIILLMSVYMIWHGNKMIKQYTQSNERS